MTREERTQHGQHMQGENSWRSSRLASWWTESSSRGFQKGCYCLQATNCTSGPQSVTFSDVLKMSIEISAYILTEVCICLWNWKPFALSSLCSSDKYECFANVTPVSTKMIILSSSSSWKTVNSQVSSNPNTALQSWVLWIPFIMTCYMDVFYIPCHLIFNQVWMLLQNYSVT